MPATYAYTARAKQGSAIKGVRMAQDQAALESELAAEGFFLITAKLLPAKSHNDTARWKRFKRKDLVAFLLHIASYLEAGIPILAALQDYQEPNNPALDEAVAGLRRAVEGGASLSEAMQTQPALFKQLHVGMVKAGESTGRLDQALHEVIKLVEWEENFVSQVKQASTYPIIILALIGLIVLLVSVFALPGILKLLQDFNIPLPTITKIFIFLGNLLAHWGWLLILLPVLGFFAFRAAYQHEDFRLWWDTRLLALPVIGVLATKIALARFAHFFAAQYRAGIPIVTVLRECEAVTGNARLSLAVKEMREGVEGGERLITMAEKVGYFPRLVVRMFGIGEEAGNLEETLGKVAKYFEAEVNAAIKRLFQLVEPTLMLLLAGLLVFVAIAILLPIYTMIGGINANH